MMNKAATLLSTVLLLGSAQANFLPGGPTDPEPTDPCEPKCCLQPRRKELEAGELFVKEAHERALEEEDAPLMCGDEPAGYSCFSEYEFCEGSCGVDYADYCGNFGGLVCYPNCPTDPPPTDPEPTDGGCCGDPHFKTWGGEWYDYHGICDLVLLKLEDFNDGQGMDIIIRTAARGQFSFIETAAIRIGSDILEVTGWGAYAVNGVEYAHLPIQLGGFKFDKHWDSEKKRVYKVFLDGAEHIKISTFKDLVSVKVENATKTTFGSSQGLMGSYDGGVWLGRDRKTVLKDANEFGEEWQATSEEGTVFQTDRFPQHPQKCFLPQATKTGRRLGEAVISEAQATAACKNWDDEHRDLCVYDVMALGDLELAEAGAY